MFKASLIISVYRNTAFLKAVLDTLYQQTVQDFEIIITEDGNDPAMREFISSYPFHQDFQHLTQEDLGWRKNRALNNAIRSARSEWLIFIDGDCLLHPRFVEMHLRYAGEKRILAGKRVKLNPILSDRLLINPMSVKKLQLRMMRNLLFKESGVQFAEEGLFLSPNSLLGWVAGLRKLKHLKGCNMSFSKAAIEAINGFDEDYTLPAVGEDADLSWRFEAAGYSHFSVRNRAVQYHLYHPENWSDQTVNLQKMFDKRTGNEYICRHGLVHK